MFHRIVWMVEEQVTAELISLGAFSSRVKFTLNGTVYDEIVINEDFIPLEEMGIEYESVGNDEEY